MFPNVKTGDIVRAEHINQLIDEIKKAQLRRVVGGSFVSNSGGTSISIDVQSGGGGGGIVKEIHPFKVVKGYDFDGQTLRVAGQSYLSNIETGQPIPITDLGAVIGGPNDNENDPGQFSFPDVGHMIWLTLEVYNLVVTSAYIEHGEPGQEGMWENFPMPVEQSTDDIPECRYSRIALAEIHGDGEDVDGDVYTIGDEKRIVRQLVNTHLGVKLGVINYVVSPIIMPWAAPGRVTWTP